MIDNILISLSFVFLVRNINSNEINDLTFKSDRLLDVPVALQGVSPPKVNTGSGEPASRNGSRKQQRDRRRTLGARRRAERADLPAHAAHPPILKLASAAILMMSESLEPSGTICTGFSNP